MKASLQRILGVFFVLLFMAVVMQSYAGCPCKKPKPKQDESIERIYVAPAQINLNGNQILVLMDDQVYQTSAIFSDEKGIYIKEYYTGDCPDGFWQCRTCGHCNERYYLWCRVCNNS